MLAATDNFLYLKVSLKLMLWSHMPVCYYKFDITHESVFSSPSLLNEYLRYDKLWGPSQRVVTLFFLFLLSGVSMRAIASSFIFQILANLVLWMCK